MQITIVSGRRNSLFKLTFKEDVFIHFSLFNSPFSLFFFIFNRLFFFKKSGKYPNNKTKSFLQKRKGRKPLFKKNCYIYHYFKRCYIYQKQYLNFMFYIQIVNMRYLSVELWNYGIIHKEFYFYFALFL